ncbi:hypothetical protein IQ03_00558 [Gemmobacter caeni]|uniref:Tail protein n=1 Tax=Gemmobacter caeni TaxID=589035 RepID=A0A2T6A5I5_9RHOB|nr:hypothetical protein [Gemmobacter caeni]PTX39079.1 hypothetical protein C8N34_13911 [Gemmobacter caeni]TWJ05750.1 hypothetical protein IQ03_00558 [Gemmobacter caeni]
MTDRVVVFRGGALPTAGVSPGDFAAEVAARVDEDASLLNLASAGDQVRLSYVSGDGQDAVYEVVAAQAALTLGVGQLLQFAWQGVNADVDPTKTIGATVYTLRASDGSALAAGDLRAASYVARIHSGSVIRVLSLIRIADVPGLSAALADTATAAQGALAVTAVQPGDDVSVLDETATAKIMTGAERTKLAGIATGATANAPDAALLARANHAGTQAISTITGLQTALDGKAVQADGRLARNRGAHYPLKSATRDGITSAEYTIWSNLLLDAQVFGARRGCYYQVAYYQNGATIGTPGYGWVIREFDAATYASDSSTARVLRQYWDTNPPTINPAGGIQSVEIICNHPDGRPSPTVLLTVDGAALPASGTPVNSNASSGLPGWSWIIDPACYRYQPRATLPARRGQIQSASNSFLEKALLDAWVYGARPGKVYGIRYFKNGTGALAGPNDGWTIEEYDAETYGSAGTGLSVLNYLQPAPDITRSGVQMVTLRSPIIDGLSFVLKIDTDELPAYGTFVKMNAVGDPGYSWIIDPARVAIAPAPTPRRLSWSADADGNLQATWQSGIWWYRLAFGPNGKNLLPNVQAHYFSPRTGSTAGQWFEQWSGPTDWLPPLIVGADVEGAATRIFTGGNHGSDGGAGGDNTARNVYYDMLIDGAAQPWEVAEGAASRITLRVVNEVMAYNTVGVGRYVLREHFVVTITAAGIEVECERTALEDISVYVDYGPQIATGGYQSTMMLLGGGAGDFVAYAAGLTSGTKATTPDAWAVILRAAHGQLASWIDRNYEAGDLRYVGGSFSLIRGSGGKYYHAVCGVDTGSTVAATIAAGESYRWRGGYTWQAPGLSETDLMATLQILRDGRPAQALIASGSNWSLLP